MDYQNELDELFYRLKTCEITIAEYQSKIDVLAGGFPDEILKKLNWRCGKRSLGEFAVNIYQQTMLERSMMDLCFQYFGNEGEHYIDCGVDNNGKLLIDPGIAVENPDFEVCRWDGTSYFVEVKPAPHDKFFTYKLDNLSSYIDTANVNLLTVVEQKSYMLLDRAGMSKILKYGEYDRHKGFGGKKTVRIYNKQFDKIGNLVEISNGK